MVSSKFLTNITLMMAKLHSISRMELKSLISVTSCWFYSCSL